MEAGAVYGVGLAGGPRFSTRVESMAEWVDGISVAKFDFQTAIKNVNTFIFQQQVLVSFVYPILYIYTYLYINEMC